MEATRTYAPATRPNRDTGEWIVRCYLDGKRHPAGDIFEETKEDMLSTIGAEVRNELKRFPCAKVTITWVKG